jgi:hypothetical protein
MKKYLKLLLFTSTLLLCGICNVNGAVISYETTLVSNTGFSTVFSIPKFIDNPNYVLTSVTFKLTGNLTGSTRVENFSNFTSPTITLNNTVNYKMGDGLSSEIINFNITKSNTYNAASFDGVIDWAGTSGAEFVFNNSITDTRTFTNTNAGDLALFTGTGFINIPIDVSDISGMSSSGPNVLISQFTNSKNVNVEVMYDYSVVPEPKVYGSAAILLCLVLLLYAKYRK